MDYILFEKGIDSKEFSDKLLNATLYASNITENKDKINICLSKDGDSND